VELRRALRGDVAGGDVLRCEPRPGVGERFRVFEDPGELDGLKQGAQIVGGIVRNTLVEVCGGCAGCGGCGDAHRRNRAHPPPPTSTNLHQPPERPHLKTIHSTPIVAASTTESTMLSWRGPAATGV